METVTFGRIVVVLTALMCAVQVTCHAEDDSLVERAKKVLAFSTWPGKNGALKKGIQFDPRGSTPLTGFVVTSDEVEIYDNLRTYRTLDLQNGAKNLRVELWVDSGSTNGAQEQLVRTFENWQIPLSFALRIGAEVAIPIGDVSVVRQNATQTDYQGEIYFVRNNVGCILSGRNCGLTAAQFIQLASDLDAAITGQQNLTKAQFDSKRPIITTFAPVNPNITIDKDTSLTIIAHDPGGETLKNIVSTAGDLSIKDDVQPVRVEMGAKAGAIPITLTVINASLQFSTAQTTVTVTLPPQQP